MATHENKSDKDKLVSEVKKIIPYVVLVNKCHCVNKALVKAIFNNPTSSNFTADSNMT